MDIIRELRDRSLSDYLFNMLSDNFLKTFKISNNINESAFPSKFTYPVILMQFSEDCKIFTRAKPPYWYKTIFTDDEYEIAIQSIVFGLDRFEEYCIKNDWKRPYTILKDFQLGNHFDPDPVFAPPPMKKLDPDEASLNEYGLIISHLPSGPRPLVKEKKKNPCSKPELFTIDRKNGW